MKILILGAKGNLGSQLVRVFSEPENKVVGLDKENIDITDEKAAEERIGAEAPDIIINAVAYNAVDKCEADEQEFALAKKINAEAAGFLARAAQGIGALFVHYSTDYVFAGDNQSGYAEDAAPAPLNNYGASKYLGEQEVLKTLAAGAQGYLIRTSKLFGPKGESEVAKPSFFDIILKAAAEKEILEIVDEEKSGFTYTADLAEATKRLIDEKKPSGIYHLTNSGAATWYEAALELFRLAGLDKKIIPVASDKFPRPARRPKYSILLNTKTSPLRPYTEALKDYLSAPK